MRIIKVDNCKFCLKYLSLCVWNIFFSNILGFSYLMVKLNEDLQERKIKIRINNDNIIEPFEFFTLIVEPESVSPSEYFTFQKKIIYIEDDDCRKYEVLLIFFNLAF